MENIWRATDTQANVITAIRQYIKAKDTSNDTVKDGEQFMLIASFYNEQIRSMNVPIKKSKLRCPYCHGPVAIVDSIEVYRQSYGPIHICRPCKAWVGCHPGTEEPLGRLANEELRSWRRMAHAAFDPIWKRKISRDKCSKGRARRAGYKWLAEQLGIKRDACHISWFNVHGCKRVVEICEKVKL